MKVSSAKELYKKEPNKYIIYHYMRFLKGCGETFLSKKFPRIVFIPSLYPALDVMRVQYLVCLMAARIAEELVVDLFNG